jgi:prolyl-tRNA synthetase
MLDVYTDFAVNEAAIPVIPGAKSDAEKFAGADVTYSIEAMMGDGKALQSGTSHFLGQNFAQAFEVRYLDQNGQLQHCWTTSWGLSTRIIGAIIMVHGDDQGLVMPPRLAPTQAVIVPIYKTDEEKASVMQTAKDLKAQLIKANLRVTLDEREGFSPGYKFNDWEMRGVPVRVELGPKDVAKQAAMLARRDRPGREGKVSASLADLPATIEKLLLDIHQSMYDKALAFRRANSKETKTYDEFKKAVETGFAFAPWCGSGDCEATIKEETRATMRCIPLDPGAVMGSDGASNGSETCIHCGKPAKQRAIFARAY